MVKREPFTYDRSRMSGSAFFEELEKQKTCKHPQVDIHRDQACPDCNKILFCAVSDGSFADGLKQLYLGSFLDDPKVWRDG